MADDADRADREVEHDLARALRKRRRNIVKPITTAAIAALLLAYGIVGTLDYEDAVAADQHYTEMVCAGYWPDYDDRKPDCGASKIPATNH